MARMLSKMSPPVCPGCKAQPPGPDCAEAGTDKRTQRRREQRELAREIAEQKTLHARILR